MITGKPRRTAAAALCIRRDTCYPKLSRNSEKIVKNWLEDLSRAKTTCSKERGRPLVTVAFAMSADGCLAAARGKKSEISGEEAVRFTHRLRGAHAALLIGIGTALADDPLLTTRFGEGPTGLRIVLDSHLRLPPASRLLSADAPPPLVVGAEGADAARVKGLEGAGARVLLLPRAPRGISLDALLAWLSARGIDSLMVEGGAHVIESFFLESTVDHLSVTRSPTLLAQDSAVRLSAETAQRVREFVSGEGRAFGVDRIFAGPLSHEEGASSRYSNASKVAL